MKAKELTSFGKRLPLAVPCKRHLLQKAKEGTKMKKRTDKGFSLIELLIVVAIIGIIAAIAIPNLLASRRASNEGSAQSSLRTISSAEATYLNTSGAGSYGSLSNMMATNVVDSVLGQADGTAKTRHMF